MHWRFNIALISETLMHKELNSISLNGKCLFNTNNVRQILASNHVLLFTRQGYVCFYIQTVLMLVLDDSDLYTCLLLNLGSLSITLPWDLLLVMLMAHVIILYDSVGSLLFKRNVALTGIFFIYKALLENYHISFQNNFVT